MIECRNGGFKERANIGAHETRVHVQSAALKDGSVALRPPAGSMPILLSANWNLENPRPGCLGIGSQAKIPGMGFETRWQNSF